VHIVKGVCGASLNCIKVILVIDDIYTTGSTFDSCSRVLKSGGAGMVYVLTFAAGGNVAPKDRL
jgi:predicted amidophosphoribosyltransferase